MMTTNNETLQAVSNETRPRYATTVMLCLPPKLATCIQQIGAELVKAGVPEKVLDDLAESLLLAGNDTSKAVSDEQCRNVMTSDCFTEMEELVARLQAALAELDDTPPEPSTRKVFINVDCHNIAPRSMVVEVPASCSNGDIASFSSGKLSDIWSSYTERMTERDNDDDDEYNEDDEFFLVKYKLRYVGDAPKSSEPDVRLSDDLNPI